MSNSKTHFSFKENKINFLRLKKLFDNFNTFHIKYFEISIEIRDQVDESDQKKLKRLHGIFINTVQLVLNYCLNIEYLRMDFYIENLTHKTFLKIYESFNRKQLRLLRRKLKLFLRFGNLEPEKRLIKEYYSVSGTEYSLLYGRCSPTSILRKLGNYPVLYINTFCGFTIPAKTNFKISKLQKKFK